MALPGEAAARLLQPSHMYAYQEEFGTFRSNPLWLADYYDRQLKLHGWDGDNQIVPTDPTEALVEETLKKANIAITSTGAWNPVYGALVHNLVSSHPGAFAALPQNPWRRTGFRVKSAAGKSSNLGRAEGAVVGTPAVPTYFEIEPTPKTAEYPTEVTEVYRAFTENDIVTVQQILHDVEIEYAKAMDDDILQDVDTLASLDFESIDRWTESSTAQAGIGFTAGDEDLHGVDRSVNTFFNSNIFHNSAVNRTLTISLVNQLAQAARPFWDSWDEQFYVTGDDTYRRWSELEEAKQRFATDTFQFDAALGLSSARGNAEAGFKIHTWEQRPVVITDKVTVESGGISRIYLLDKTAGYIGVAVPMQFVTSDNPLIVGHVQRSALYMIGEAVCNNPKKIAQLRDLS